MPNNQTSSTPSVNPRTTTQRGKRAPKGVLRRLLRMLFEFYPVLLPVTMAVSYTHLTLPTKLEV